MKDSEGGESFWAEQILEKRIYIYYAAAAYSTSYAEKACPAFNHRRRVVKLNVEQKKGNYRFTATRKGGVPVTEDVRKFGWQELIFDGGPRLIGSYSIEAAFYNSKTQERKSEFLEIEDRVEVTEERDDSITGC